HISRERTLKIDERAALHPSLRGLADVWEAGRLAVVEGVGYPKHNRSHFLSTAIWHAARLDATPYGHDGWVGRALDSMQTRSESPLTCSVGVADTPRVLSARQTRCVVPPHVPFDEVQQLAALLTAERQGTPGTAMSFVKQLRIDASASLRDLAARESSA